MVLMAMSLALAIALALPALAQPVASAEVGTTATSRVTILVAGAAALGGPGRRLLVTCLS
jgi:hypothetical protein